MKRELLCTILVNRRVLLFLTYCCFKSKKSRGEISNQEVLGKEQHAYKPVPIVRQVSNEIVQMNYLEIKQEVENLIDAEMTKIIHDPEIEGTVIKKSN